MTEFIPGQRWISNAEFKLGLGTVLSVDHRIVSILYHATGETRNYAKQNAPLTRVRFSVGDNVLSHHGWSLRVTEVLQQDGLLIYRGFKEDGDQVELHESELDNHIQLNQPVERLFTGQIDKNKWFELRYQTLQHINRLSHSEVRGLCGGRTSLIPHQLHIAHQVAMRYAPRVLLADEVGLGKTIEAGMIIHQQLLSERAQRVLIVVPETLVHQWLVEMLRRFNIRFSVFNQERCEASEESHNLENPFDEAQLVICSLDFLCHYPRWHERAMQSEWDLLVVDEAHHLQWSPESSSREYSVVEQLARRIKGVLLLTATPEQLGKASHFARLRLLDPDRFHNYEQFLSEEHRYEPIADAVQELAEDSTISQATRTLLMDTLDPHHCEALIEEAQAQSTDEQRARQIKNELIEQLLDHHGTGRVLFRNTRHTIKGFPERQVHPYPLPKPKAYNHLVKPVELGEQADYSEGGICDQLSDQQAQLLLCPERLYALSGNDTQTSWLDIDPRIAWLENKLVELRPQKALLITVSSNSALAIAGHIKTKTGIRCAVFHEGLSILERDKAAAYFAEQDDGAQVLICSEIGSEGRNFQFAHHLILFDLPLNPDLLEQRIGRLDRIGQNHCIDIHVPYIQDSPQASMYHWYQHGLQAMSHICPAGHTVFSMLRGDLLDNLCRYHEFSEQGIDPEFLKQTQVLYQELNQELQRGRDRLLEYNSCPPHHAESLVKRVQSQENSEQLQDYINLLFDCYAVDIEIGVGNTYVLRPTDQMQCSSFPGLAEDGMRVSFDRDVALSREDAQFITWEHPLVLGAIDMVLSNEQGNAAITAIKQRGIRPGTLLLESVYILETASSEQLQTSRYLPPTAIRIVTDPSGKNMSEQLTHKAINKTAMEVNRETTVQIIKNYGKEIRSLMNASEQHADTQGPRIIENAQNRAHQLLDSEIERLRALSKVNPNVRDEEIEYFETLKKHVSAQLETAKWRLDAVRVIVTT